MGEQRIAIRRDYKKGGATMQNRAAYVITSEKAKKRKTLRMKTK